MRINQKRWLWTRIPLSTSANWRFCTFPQVVAILILTEIREQEKCSCSFAVREAKYYIGPFVLDQEQSSSVLMYQGENVLAAQRSIISSLLFRSDLLTNYPVRRAGPLAIRPLADGIPDGILHDPHRIEMQSDSMRKNRGKTGG